MVFAQNEVVASPAHEINQTPKKLKSMNAIEQEIVNRLQLQPHREGGFFKESYRSDIFLSARSLPDTFGGRRTMATSIVYFLPAGSFSAFHRLKQDEIWNFHAGSVILPHTINSSDGLYNCFELGDGVSGESVPQVIIPAGTYFAAEASQGYGLVGCVATPGFDYADLEMPVASRLVKLFPQHESIIRKFSRS
mgnify:CR=1 FL=1